MIKSTKRLILAAIFSFTLLLQTGAFAAMATKNFSDYVNITPTSTSQPAMLRTHYFAKQKVNDRAPDPLYKNNQWKLVQRRGLFLAQKDKAMSEMYRYFLGYSTDVDIVEEKGDIFIARRIFKGFKKSYNPKREIRDYLRKDENNYLVGKYLLLDDGRLIKDSEEIRFRGLGSLAVLTDFFGEADHGSWNFGYQVSDDEIKAVFYDNEHALNFEKDEDKDGPANLEGDLVEALGQDFINMTWYQQEKQQMLKKIAETDFSVIETILRKNITGSRLDEARYVLNKVLSDPTVLPDFDRAEAKKQLEEVNKMDDKEHGIDQIIRQLRIRHEKLRSAFALRATARQAGMPITDNAK